MVVGTGAVVRGTVSSGTDTSSFFTVRTLGPTGAVLCARAQLLVSADLSLRLTWRARCGATKYVDRLMLAPAHRRAEAPQRPKLAQ